MGDGALPAGGEGLLRGVYAAFNAQRPSAALASMRAEVLWPSPGEDRHDVGHDAVYAWWAHQYREHDSRISPRSFRLDEDGYSVVADVHQILRNRAGEIVLDRRIEHVYVLHLGLVVRMDLRAASA